MKFLGATLLVTFLFAAAGCGELVESESGREFAERNLPVPSDSEVEATLNAFEAALHEKKASTACEYLTPRSLRELGIGAGDDPGRLTREAFKRGCVLYLKILSKGVKIPLVHIEVQKVDKEEFKDRYYLNVYPQRGPSIVLNSGGTKIAILSGTEQGE